MEKITLNSNFKGLDKSKKYFAYVTYDFISSKSIPQLLTGYTPLYFLGDMPLKINKNENVFHIDTSKLKGIPEYLQEEEFYKFILGSKKIQGLFERIISNQGELLIKSFVNNKAFSPQFEKEGVHCFGLTPEQREKYDNKLHQINLFKGILPYPKHIISKRSSCERDFDKIKSNLGVFVSLPKANSRGSGCKIVKNKFELRDFLDASVKENFILVEAMNLKRCPSIDVLIANEKQVFSYGVLDQIYGDSEFPLGCTGNAYPSKLSKKIQNQIKEMAVTAGKTLAKDGLKGVYVSLDFNVDEKDNIFFGEINARYAGSTAERMLMMELNRPSRYPTVLDLEKMASKNKDVGSYTLWEEPNIYLCRKEFFVNRKCKVAKIPNAFENELYTFKKKKASITGIFPKIGSEISPGTSITRLVSVADDEKTMLENMKNLEQKISSCLV